MTGPRILRASIRTADNRPWENGPYVTIMHGDVCSDVRWCMDGDTDSVVLARCMAGVHYDINAMFHEHDTDPGSCVTASPVAGKWSKCPNHLVQTVVDMLLERHRRYWDVIGVSNG